MPPLILVVDDEPVLRRLLSELLTEEGYRVAEAVDGQAALDSLELDTPNLIVSDIKMPRVHGLLLVQRLRERGLTTPVVLISTWVPPDGMPGVRFVRKPFDLEQITGAVRLGLAGG